jgi:hypothetical protein
MFLTKVQDKFETYFVFNKFLLKNRAIYETMWRNVEKPNRQEILHGACVLHPGY